MKQLHGVKPYIDTIRGKARYIGTEIENDEGRFNDRYETNAGYYLIHRGKEHHVYKV